VTTSPLPSRGELVATAIANAEARSLTASWARIVASAEQTRRINRDLHDGASDV
jgi:hypothetical protein